MAEIIIGVIVGLIILFIACRELICWYFKINKLVELMEQQNSLLSSLNSKITSFPNVRDNNSINSSRTIDIEIGDKPAV